MWPAAAIRQQPVKPWALPPVLTGSPHLCGSKIVAMFARLGFVVFFWLGIGFTLQAQSGTAESLWKTLAKITYRKEFDEFLGFKIDKPVFSDEIKALAGKEVTVKGFIIPVEGYKGHKEFIFSAFPYSMCFFCGGAG